MVHTPEVIGPGVNPLQPEAHPLNEVFKGVGQMYICVESASFPKSLVAGVNDKLSSMVHGGIYEQMVMVYKSKCFLSTILTE